MCTMLCAEYGVQRSPQRNYIIIVSDFFFMFLLFILPFAIRFNLQTLFLIMRLSVSPETCDQQHGTTRSTYGNKLNRLSKTYEMIKLAEHSQRKYYKMDLIHHYYYYYVMNVLHSRHFTRSFSLSIWNWVSCELIVYVFYRRKK